MVYSALQTRRLQANLFNVQDNEYDVLVTSDAIGTGLNLNIRRVKQIAGRAGRRGSVYPHGLTTTLHLDDLDYLIECLKEPFEEVKKVGPFPFYEQVELFAGQLLNLTFSQFLEQFHDNCRLDGFYFLCQHDHIIKVAKMLEKAKFACEYCNGDAQRICKERFRTFGPGNKTLGMVLSILSTMPKYKKSQIFVLTLMSE
ncbi:hypothetical protein SAY86_024677 [Trapa natans]|uniref:RNA helicase n=1 Tax=Trapa natans TaxID=22666 RepID=A0AAN7MHR6_TRANT|nr:hypothetical protein SAY86_024677 [Trapa natans]